MKFDISENIISGTVLIAVSFLIIFLIVLVTVSIFKTVSNIYSRYLHKQFEKIARISQNYKQLNKLNAQYRMRPLNKYNYNIVVAARSYQKYQKLLGREVIRYHIEQNIDGIREDLALAVASTSRYSSYIQKATNLNFATDEKFLLQEKKSRHKFKKYEKKLIKRTIVANPTKISAKIKIYYRSPRGRNYYEKQGKFDYEKLSLVYKDWSKKQDYRISSKYERSLMSDSLRYDVFTRDHYRCCICGASQKDGVTLHVDHIIPVSKGGKTVMSNLQTLCDRCNLGKSNKI